MDKKFLIFVGLLFLLSSCSSSKYPAEPSLPADNSFLSLEDGLSYFDSSSENTFLIGAVTSGNSVDVPLSDTRYVYKYYYVYHDGKWEKKAFSGASESDTGWILVQKDTLITEGIPNDPTIYIAVYSCSSRSCSGEGWKVHEFKFTSPTTAPDVMPGSAEVASPAQPTLKKVAAGSTPTNPYGFKRSGGFSSSTGARIPVVPQCVNESDCSAFHDCINQFCVRRQCSDGLDNDGDGLIDWGFASGNDQFCSSPFDNSEAEVLYTTIGWNDFPEFNLHSNLTAIYGGIPLSGCYQSTSICVEDVGLAALNKGFSHIAVYDNMTQAQKDSIPRAKRAAMWGPFGDTTDHPVRQEPLYKYYMPWNNNFSVYYSPMDTDLARIANYFSDSNGTGIPNVDILAADVESQLTTDQEIADLRGNSTKAALIPDQFK